jgi:hypothetical protein
MTKKPLSDTFFMAYMDKITASPRHVKGWLDDGKGDRTQSGTQWGLDRQHTSYRKPEGCPILPPAWHSFRHRSSRIPNPLHDRHLGAVVAIEEVVFS